MMGEAGRRAVAERFSPERHLSALLDAYGETGAAWEATRGEARAGARSPRTPAKASEERTGEL